MKFILALLLLIPSLSWGNKNKDSTLGAQLYTECNDLIDGWERFNKNDDTRDFMIYQYSHLLIGYISGINTASINSDTIGVEIFDDSTNPEFLFQYILNYCKQNNDDRLWQSFMRYFLEKKNLGKTLPND